MEKIWLDSYPKGVGPEVDTNEYSSLNDVMNISVSRFGEMHSTWRYSKQENLTDFTAFDYLLTSSPSEKNGFEVVGSPYRVFHRLNWKTATLETKDHTFIMKKK